jgi:cephalosporin hydroxylase
MIAGLKLMVVGEKRRFWFPQPGPNAGPQVLDVELLDIQDLNQETTLTKAQVEVVEQFNQIYASSHIQARNITWLGVEIQQNPCDLWMMQEIILQLRPDYIIETGTYTGGSALYFASLLELAGIDGRVITIDINPQVEGTLRHKLFQNRVEVIQSDSTAPELIEKLAARVTGKKVLVTLDSLHTKDHVLKELNLYAPLVSVNSYLVVQDTRIRDFFPTAGPGPGEAVAEFLKTRVNFVVDRSREQLLLTYYPGGYLKRIK